MILWSQQNYGAVNFVPFFWTTLYNDNVIVLYTMSKDERNCFYLKRRDRDSTLL